jgi:2-hydroxycyclohexanecarboxyl-CoA dehydrogenase
VQTGLAGKVVIVTAATANIGRGIALAFAAEGARVVIVGRDAVAGELVAKLAREQGAADALWRPADQAAFVTGHTLQIDGGVSLV